MRTVLVFVVYSDISWNFVSFLPSFLHFFSKKQFPTVIITAHILCFPVQAKHSITVEHVLGGREVNQML